MANNTDVNAVASYKVRSIEKGTAQTQVVTLDLGGSGAESLVSGAIPVSGSVTVVEADALTTEIDDAGTYLYVGKATPGSATSTAAWQILRVVNATGSSKWADGDKSFNNVWDDRASLTYS